MKLTSLEVEHIALLARLGLGEEEKEVLREQLSDILDHFQILQEVDTTGVEPTSQVTGLVNVLREDIKDGSLLQKEILANAPDTEDGFFKIRAVLE